MKNIKSWIGEIRTPIAEATDLQSADLTNLPSIQYAESKGIEPLTRRLARFSRPLKHHCLLLSIFEVMTGFEPVTFRVATLHLRPLGHITICGGQENRTLTAFLRNNLAGCPNEHNIWLPSIKYFGWDLNPHWTGLKPVVSASWTTEAFVHPEGFEPSTPRA